MSKSGSRLSRLGVLAPAALSACIDASVLAAPAAGALLSTVLNELNKAFMLKKWFHGVMSAQEAEQLLLEKGKQGSYLVRESLNHPGEYVISVRVRGRVSHVLIRREHNKYNVGSGEFFDDLSGLIEHCRAYPLTKASGEVLRLRQPVSEARNRPRVNMDKDNNNKSPAQLLESKQTEQKEIMDRQIEDIAQHSEKIFQKEDSSIRTYPVFANSKSYAHGMSDEINPEYEEMVKAADKLVKFKKTEGFIKENKNKNRYRDIVPYDETRVILPRQTLSLDEKYSDYINASYVRPQWMFDKVFPRVNGILEPIITLHSADWEDIRDKSPYYAPRPNYSDSASSSHSYSMPGFCHIPVGKIEEVTRSSSLLESDNTELELNNYFPPNQIRHRISGVAKDKFYIATQGCLLITRHAFWAMIADNDVRVIAMVTKCVEKRKRKSDKYWPEVDETWTFGDIKVTLVYEYFHPIYITREIQLTIVTDAIKRTTTVYQYQFLEWPDQGVPSTENSLLRFIRDINTRMMTESQKPNAPKHNILCVHCSAGVGRTGTFIAIDMLIDMIKASGHIDFYTSEEVPAIVRLLRKQRPGMVHNIIQYSYIYKVLNTYISNILTNGGVEPGPNVSY